MNLIGDSQKQVAGDASTQIQAGTVIVNEGINEKRAREIVDEKLNEVVSKYSQEAHKIATERYQAFANDLIPKLVKHELLEYLADPSIQILLFEAGKSAISTEREVDTKLLSELLIHRIEKGEDRNIRAGVNRAVKIVDEISDDGLLGLTLAHAISKYSPVCTNLDDALKILSGLFGKLTYRDLPKDEKWIDHLDVLGAVRINPIIKWHKIREICASSMSGIVDIGIARGSDAYINAIDILNKVHLKENVLIPHDLNNDYYRLAIVNIEQLDNIFIVENNRISKQPITKKINDDQKQAFRDIYALYEKNPAKLQANKDAFMEHWNSYGSLRMLGQWWDAISIGFSITSVGEVLAHANAKRCDSNIPELN